MLSLKAAAAEHIIATSHRIFGANALREKFNLFFKKFFSSINKTFNLAGGLGAGLSFYGV